MRGHTAEKQQPTEASPCRPCRSPPPPPGTAGQRADRAREHSFPKQKRRTLRSAENCSRPCHCHHLSLTLGGSFLLEFARKTMEVTNQFSFPQSRKRKSKVLSFLQKTPIRPICQLCTGHGIARPARGSRFSELKLRAGQVEIGSFSHSFAKGLHSPQRSALGWAGSPAVWGCPFDGDSPRHVGRHTR